MKKFILVALFLIGGLPASVRAQYYRPENRIWAMGDHSGVDVSNALAIPLTTSIEAMAGSASVCDEDGRLLFYTNGSSVWNAAGTLMPHGTDITGSGLTSSAGVSQSALIVPGMERCGVYYLFSLASTNFIQSLYCSRIDMNLAGGQGDIDTAYSLNKVLLKGGLSDKMVAVKGANNNVWIMTHAQQQTRFYAYHLSASGLDTVPVVSDAGAGTLYSSGVMKASPQGNLLLVCNSPLLELFDFNAASGTVSNARTIDVIATYGGTFSPDGTKLYVLDIPSKMVQYDLNQINPAQTKVVLSTHVALADVKLAYNHKIYFKSIFGGGMGYSFLGSIEAPDSAGLACHLRDTVSSMFVSEPFLNGLHIGNGLPNEVVVGASPPPPGNRVVSDRRLCSFPAAGISLQAESGFNSYTWDNGINTYSRTISDTGTYWVRYTTFCGSQTDTFKIRNTGGLPPLNISYHRPLLSVNTSYTSYQWYLDGSPIAGATQSDYTATSDGWYSVLVKKDTLCSDSAAYHVTGLTGINNPSLEKAVTVYPNPVSDVLYIKAPEKVSLSLLGPDGRLLLHARATNSLDMKGLGRGLYFFQIYDLNGNKIKMEKVLKW
ncbi:T9SS type A sorting domain-containing protein [Taibaiella koreensis]|uniref:T9SS type A sorting domain-containing protein n=1 Tax=Taibaiella koreensis TaxID=1268548 RepID=UPI000E59C385|nr:T9SS type A sorting domain-containing protein [Taibaiella koreensis]